MSFRSALAASLLALPATAAAQTVTWGNTPGDVVLNSAGEKLTSSWKFELGVFLPGFFPTQENIAEWVPNWVPLDSAKLNEKIGYFSSRAPASDKTAAGLQAYIWIFNERKYNSASEWLLVTDRDGNHSNDWMIPNRSSEPTSAVLDWRVARATTVLMGNAPRLTAETKPVPPRKPILGKTFSTRPVPEAAIIAANKKAGEKDPTTAIAGEVAEEFLDE